MQELNALLVKFTEDTKVGDAVWTKSLAEGFGQNRALGNEEQDETEPAWMTDSTSEME